MLPIVPMSQVRGYDPGRGPMPICVDALHPG